MVLLYLYGIYIGTAVVLGILKYREMDKTKFIEEIEMTRDVKYREEGLQKDYGPIR